MCKYVGTWGLYPLFSGDGEELVYPSDFQKFSKLHAYGKLFHCIGESEGYLVLQHKLEIYRVKPDLYQPTSTPTFVWGDRVKDKNHPEYVGIIDDIEWHYKFNNPMYFIVVSGKRKTKRYFENDLEILDYD